MKTAFALIAFCFVASNLIAQYKRASHWLFGYKAYVSFNTGSLVTTTVSQMETIEGSSSISDLQGNLLFYTNGTNVWDRTHTVMNNGSGLNGEPSSAQSSLIVPLPGSANLYYLFTTSAFNYGACYSIVDMGLSGGFGDVALSSKNIQLLSSCTEMLGATMHCNATDYWVVIQNLQAGVLQFHSYQLTQTGLNTPVISTFNFNNPIWNAVGNITFSQNGDLMAYNSTGTSIFLFNFDKQTGSFSFRDSIPRQQTENIYSNALSPSGTKLYTTSWIPEGYSTLSCYDLQTNNIRASRVNIDSVDYSGGSPNGFGFIGQVRLAPDQKIYVSRWHQKQPFIVNPGTYYSLDSLDVINFPDQPALLCGFQRNSVWLKNQPTEIGLPTFVSNFTYSVAPQSSCVQTGLYDLPTNEQIEIFPNPSNGRISITNACSNCSIRILNSEGIIQEEIMLPDDTRANSLDIDVKCGLYLLVLTDNNNQVKAKRKILIKEE